MAEYEGSSSLFAIFVLSIYSLILTPYTFIYLCSDSEAEPWVEKSGKKKDSKIGYLLKRLFTRGNLILLALWIGWFVVLWYAQSVTREETAFDPFEILGVGTSATDREIKKAYRGLSLIYHPDKNPDPKAHAYFAESITKAYQALTDDVSRANYEKYGHPDGPQAMNIGIALPEWIFPKDKKVAPLLLLALVCVGVLLPLVFVSWHMLSANKFTGPNGIMQETLQYYLHSKFSVKESQSLVRIPETLVCAMEFISMPTPSEQGAALEELRKMVLRYAPELKEKPAFWKRKSSVLKAHMLLLSHLERDQASIPAILQADLKFVLQKSMPLLEEMLKIALLTRPPHGYGWLTPSFAIMEMMQCLTQALDLDSRKAQGGKPGDTSAQLLQLPHFDLDTLKKLKRKRVNNLKELMEMPDAEREEALTSSGVTSAQLDDVDTFLKNHPNVVISSAQCVVDGEADIVEQDITKFQARVLLTRPSHNAEGFQVRGKSARAYAPLYPAPKEENWYFFLVDANTNSVLCNQKVNLMEAETVGLDRPDVLDQLVNGASTTDAKKAVGDSKYATNYTRKGSAPAADEKVSEVGQLIEMKFMAPVKAGKYELTLVIMSDSYVGCDRSMPVKIKVTPLTRQISEGRDAKSVAATQKWASDDDRSDGEKEQDAEDGVEEEDEEDDGDDYDSDESGELETGDEASDAGDEKVDGGEKKDK